ncbi:MAG: trigger factor, partial [Clostridia bacterium]|nr:trigger factor [Clostridia bacterium]
INDLINAEYDAILAAPGKEVVSRPEFDIVSYEGDLVLKADMFVKPEVEVSDYKGIKVSAVKAPVTEEEVTAEIDNVRKRNAREIEVTDRAAAMGDTATIDYEGFVDDVPFDGGKDTDSKLKLGSGTFIPGFEEQVAGHSIGEDFDVNVTFPEDYHAKELAGKAAVFKVKLKAITFEELPEADDSFAVDVSEFDTFADYKADIEKKIAERHDKDAEREVTEKLDNALADMITIEIPAAMIDREVEGLVSDASNRISMNGIDFNTYLSYFGMTLDKYKETVRPDAEKAVKVRLALEKIAELENIEISDDAVAAEFDKIAAQYNIDVETVKAQLPAEEIVKNLKLTAASDAVKAAAEIEYTDKAPEAATEA